MLEICRLIRTTNSDILIVADKSDLNVYKTANVDGKEVGCCGSAGQAKSSCNGGNDAVEMGGELEDIDLNEWAGKILPFYQICCAKQLMFMQAHTKYMPSDQRVEKNTAD